MIKSVHGTLTANVAASVGLVGASTTIVYTDTFGASASFVRYDDFQSVEVLNRSGTEAIYFTTDGTAPTVNGNNTYVVAAVPGSALRVKLGRDHNPTVRLISPGAEDYSVSAR